MTTWMQPPACWAWGAASCQHCVEAVLVPFAGHATARLLQAVHCSHCNLRIPVWESRLRRVDPLNMPKNPYSSASSHCGNMHAATAIV